MQRMIAVFISMVVLFGASVSISSAGEVDVLIDKLVEKGVLTPVEAQIILDETKQEVAKEISQAKSSSLPLWVQKITLKQDLRLRYQYEKKDSSDQSRSRGRVRYRLGLQTNVIDSVKVGVGLATGGDDPRSTNQTFENTFESPDIRLDYAYAQVKPIKDLSLIAGKFHRKPYLWEPTDLLWDGDINPEGAALHYDLSLVDGLDSFVNAGVLVLDENGTEDKVDPFMHYLQAGLVGKIDDLDSKLAVTYYGFNGLQGVDPDHSKDTNTRITGNVLKYDYDAIAVSAEVGVKEPFDLSLPRVAVFGDYVHNLSNDVDEDSGWALGCKVGAKKVKKSGQWQGKYIYARLGRDAFPDTFPDSDRYGGRTDVKSHEVVFSYALNKNIILSLDYYQSNFIKADSNKEQVAQADILFKF